MRFKQLFPSYPADPFQFGQCQAWRECSYSTDRKYPKGTRHRCAKSARFEFDGVRLCTQHASAFALKYLLAKEREV